MLNRLNRSLYHCARLKHGDAGYVEGMELFAEPVKRMVDYLPISGETTLATAGEINRKYYKARMKKCPFAELDRCYIYIKPPIEHDPMCTSADYRVLSVLPGHNVIEVIFERLV